MNTLGQIAFPGLNNVTWLAENFQTFQEYIQAFQLELLADHRSVGIIYGGQLTVVSGLTVKVAAGAALFSNGILVTWADQNLTLSTADPSNPRIDRVELAYALTDNSTIEDNATPPDTLTFDQIYVASAVKNTGTPAGSPSANATTSGNISVGLVTVGTGAVSLSGGNLSQLEDSAFTPSSFLLGDASHLMRLNRTKSAFEYSFDGGTNWATLPVPLKASIANNQVSAADLTGFLFSSAIYLSARIQVEIRIETSTNELVAVGDIFVFYRELTSSWDIEAGDLHGDDTGVTFSITSAGQIQYTSGNVSGSGYAATVKGRVHPNNL